MDKLFLANDVLTSEMEELFGGKKVTIVVIRTNSDGTKTEVRLEYEV
ncbi:hypothetical protein [Bacteroides pyogenes]|nr:hypothetical protein [Bacteroides pyogenes]MBR8726049.1 hypothetical protein [Bacteroides pyogenes]MBR8739346.1 hypothetical protein [Bacteroides pyogenes]MBR8755213.1 hypothetical protein [Bacteroides pyogenes]MBR8796535.1 hypothetical protein [Bacteroides pyogenes]MBR8810059.1 hypothetical protein [Bacteroides pyogenes]